tara:strand:- start:418 stop:705 length:288 start_codon:yes stop_codon:yes gene_type:complete
MAKACDTRNYRDRIVDLLEEARDYTGQDDKRFASTEQLQDLIGAGAEILSLNSATGSGVITTGYKHEVLYDKLKFIASTEKPIILTIEQGYKSRE